MSTKIKSIESKSFTNNSTGKTSVSHTVVLEDGVSGYLDDKSSDKDLKQGETVNYLIEVKQNKKGGNYNLLTIKRDGVTTAPSAPAPQAQTPPPTGSQPKYSSQRSIQDWKAQSAIDAMGFMVDAVATGKIDWPQLREKQREACTILWDEIDEIFNSKG